MNVRRRREIAEELLGSPIDENGHAPCPGRHLHTKKNRATDFRVGLGDEPWKTTTAPAGSCFHASCEGEVAEFNRRLQSRVGKEEFAARRAADPGIPPPTRRRREPARVDYSRPVRYAPGILESFVGRWKDHSAAGLCHLGRLSCENPAFVTSGGFLDLVFPEGDRVLVFTSNRSQGDFLWKTGEPGIGWALTQGQQSMSRQVADLPRGGDQGVFFLNNPVSGEWAPNNPGARLPWTRRGQRCITAWRFMVLESDEASAIDWLRAVVRLPLPIRALYTSGGKSIHALVQVDATSKADWDRYREVARKFLLTLGADNAAITAVRLTRLPWCWRGRPGRWQKLLFVTDEASDVPLADREPRREEPWQEVVETAETWAGRWADLVPAQRRELLDQIGPGLDLYGAHPRVAELREVLHA